MIGLALIRALFPARFQRDYGAEWELVAEEVLALARSQGRGAYARAWMGLLLDTGLRAPVAHAQEWRDALVGQPPQLAGMGVWAATQALSWHWIARPLKGFFSTIARYAVVFGLGGAGAFLLHFWLEKRATQEVMLLLQPSAESYSSNPVSLSLFLSFLAFFLVLMTSKRSLRRGWRAWKRSGHGILAPLLVFSLGVVFALHAILLSSLNALGYELDTVFISYPSHRDFPAAIPRHDQLASEWTREQRYWFNFPLQDLLPVVKSERLAQWCALQEGAMQGRRTEIQSRMGPGAQIEALLWNGATANMVAHGCFSVERAFDEQLQMADVVTTRPDVFQLTWEPLSLFPIFDHLTLSRYAVQPRLFPDVLRYCLHTAGVESQHRPVDSAVMTQFCVDQHDQWAERAHAQHVEAPASRWQRLKWSLNLDYTGRLKHSLQGAPRMQREDLVWIREAVVANQDRWLEVGEASADQRRP